MTEGGRKRSIEAVPFNAGHHAPASLHVAWMVLLGIQKVVSNLFIYPRLDVVAVKIYEERTIVSTTAHTWTPIVGRSAAEPGSMEAINRLR